MGYSASINIDEFAAEVWQISCAEVGGSFGERIERIATRLREVFADRATPAAQAASEGDFRIAFHEWAVAGWRSEVQNRPLVNIHRKRLDDFWRHAIRKAGGDPDAIVGPSHDALSAPPAGTAKAVAQQAEPENCRRSA